MLACSSEPYVANMFYTLVDFARTRSLGLPCYLHGKFHIHIWKVTSSALREASVSGASDTVEVAAGRRMKDPPAGTVISFRCLGTSTECLAWDFDSCFPKLTLSHMVLSRAPSMLIRTGFRQSAFSNLAWAQQVAMDPSLFLSFKIDFHFFAQQILG